MGASHSEDCVPELSGVHAAERSSAPSGKVARAEHPGRSRLAFPQSAFEASLAFGDLDTTKVDVGRLAPRILAAQRCIPVQTARPVYRIRGSDGSYVRALAWDPFRDLLVSGGGDGFIRLWDTATYGCKGEAQTPQGCRSLLVLTRQLVSGHSEGHVVVWDMEAGLLFRSHLLLAHREAVYSLVMLRSGDLVTGAEDIRVFARQDGDPDADFVLVRALPQEVLCMCTLPGGANGTLVLTGNMLGQLAVWETGSEWQLARHCLGHEQSVWCIAYLRDARRVASGGADNALRIWNPQTWACEHVFHEHTGWIVGLSSGPGCLLSCSVDRTVLAWDVETWTCQRAFGGVGGPQIFCVCAFGGGRFAAAGDDGTAVVYGGPAQEAEGAEPFESLACRTRPSYNFRDEVVRQNDALSRDRAVDSEVAELLLTVGPGLDSAPLWTASVAAVALQGPCSPRSGQPPSSLALVPSRPSPAPPSAPTFVSPPLAPFPPSSPASAGRCVAPLSPSQAPAGRGRSVSPSGAAPFAPPLAAPFAAPFAPPLAPPAAEAWLRKDAPRLPGALLAGPAARLSLTPPSSVALLSPTSQRPPSSSQPPLLASVSLGLVRSPPLAAPTPQLSPMSASPHGLLPEASLGLLSPRHFFRSTTSPVRLASPQLPPVVLMSTPGSPRGGWSLQSPRAFTAVSRACLPRSLSHPALLRRSSRSVSPSPSLQHVAPPLAAVVRAPPLAAVIPPLPPLSLSPMTRPRCSGNSPGPSVGPSPSPGPASPPPSQDGAGSSRSLSPRRPLLLSPAVLPPAAAQSSPVAPAKPSKSSPPPASLKQLPGELKDADVMGFETRRAFARHPVAAAAPACAERAAAPRRGIGVAGDLDFETVRALRREPQAPKASAKQRVYSVGEEVSVYSTSQKEWLVARVSCVESGNVTLVYRLLDGNFAQKILAAGSEHLKPRGSK